MATHSLKGGQGVGVRQALRWVWTDNRSSEGFFNDFLKKLLSGGGWGQPSQ